MRLCVCAFVRLCAVGRKQTALAPGVNALTRAALSMA